MSGLVDLLMFARKQLDTTKASLEAKLAEMEAKATKKTAEVANLNLRLLQMRKQLDDSQVQMRKTVEDSKARLKNKESELTETKDIISTL